MSGAPIISGTIQLPKPPIIAGITMKKIMISPCAVTNTLNIVRSSWKMLQAGIHQLGADQRSRSTPPISAGDEREHEVHRADVLVVRRIDDSGAIRAGWRARVSSAMCYVRHRIHRQSLRPSLPSLLVLPTRPLLRPRGNAGEDRHRAEAPATAIAVGGRAWSIGIFLLRLPRPTPCSSLSFTTRTDDRHEGVILAAQAPSIGRDTCPHARL